jgi:hypothetical protein
MYRHKERLASGCIFVYDVEGMMRADDGTRRWSYRASPLLGTAAADYDTGSPPGRDARMRAWRDCAVAEMYKLRDWTSYACPRLIIG